MDSKILADLYHSIYEDQEVLDEGIIDAVFGDPKKPKNVARNKKARQKQKEALVKAMSNKRKPDQSWGQAGSHGYSDKAMFKEDYLYILDYLVTEGFVNTIQEAEVVFNAMSTDWIDEILSESI